MAKKVSFQFTQDGVLRPIFCKSHALLRWMLTCLCCRFSSVSWSQTLLTLSTKSASCRWRIMLPWLKMKSSSYESKYVNFVISVSACLQMC